MSIAVKIKKIFKNFIDYSLTEDYRVYRLKHTPLRFRVSYTKDFYRYYNHLQLVPNKIVFENYKGKGFGCNCKYVLLQLLQQEQEYDLVWTVSDVEACRNQFPPEVRLVKFGSRDAMKEYATAGIWVSNFQMVHYLNKGLRKKQGQTYIQLWHGSFGIKKIERDTAALNEDRAWMFLAKMNSCETDYWISNSSFETQVYRNAFWNVRQVLEYGHPRNDLFFSQKGIEVRDNVRRSLHLAEKKILLYLPTFRDDSFFEDNQVNYGRVKDCLEQRFGGNWCIVVRMHPKMKEIGQKMLFPQEEYIYDGTNEPDVQELLAAADAVLTDYSSAVFDFGLTGRPAFLFAPDYQRYETMRGLYYPLEQTPFPTAVTQEQLEKKICQFEMEAYEQRLQEFYRQKGSVEDGHASWRVGELIKKIVQKAGVE